MQTEFVLIHGVFFQDREWLGLDTRPVEGVVAVINRGLCRYQFAGVLERYPQGQLVGEVQDAFGEAEVSNVILTETALKFRKKYSKRADYIYYVFTKQPDGTWVGIYTGDVVGSGTARCILTPVSGTFFTPPGGQ